MLHIWFRSFFGIIYYALKNHNSGIDELSRCILTFCPGEIRGTSPQTRALATSGLKDLRFDSLVLCTYVITKKRCPFPTSTSVFVVSVRRQRYYSTESTRLGGEGHHQDLLSAQNQSCVWIPGNSKLLNCFRRAVTLTMTGVVCH